MQPADALPGAAEHATLPTCKVMMTLNQLSTLHLALNSVNVIVSLLVGRVSRSAATCTLVSHRLALHVRSAAG